MNHHPREDLGAYAIGALEPAERHGVDAHLERCASCRDEVARLSALRPLLDRLTAQEFADERLGHAPSPAVASVTAAVVSPLRRSVRRWRLAAVASAAAAAAAGALLWAPWTPAAPIPVTAAVAAVAGDATATAGTVSAYAWDWGTTLDVDVAALPARSGYVVWAVAGDGERDRAGSWGPTAGGSARVRGATAIARDRIVVVEVTDADGEVLVAAELPDA